MDYTILPAILVISSSLFAYNVLSQTCYDLDKKCWGYIAKEGPAYEKLATLSPGSNSTWPVTEEILQEYRLAGEAYCRQVSENAYCLRHLLDFCPGFYDDCEIRCFTRHDSELRMIIARLCETTVGPVQMIRAVTHCTQQDPEHFRSCCLVRSEDGKVERNGTIVAARHNACRDIQATTLRMNGTQGEEMAIKCGHDAMDTIKEAFTQLYALHCLN
ncbi:uncharacterized protein LOC129591509 [Paramacrobiotus metropolitanus]|uniref:uncharacterized protein LOC129591509 n=1 Tax=Paramacrobiotus metropolitanus TaxID=2943436 RepID=UPI00244560C3|nr:uncharacterized protein LOC129591509 [Paramacrobiotus metropolitanus]